MVQKANGKEVLLLEVANTLMPEEEGYNSSEVINEILVRGDFSIRQVVDATFKVLSKKVSEELKRNTQDIKIYGFVEFPLNGDKRLVLRNENNITVVSSNYFSINTDVKMKYQGVEYRQHGKDHFVYSREL